MPRKKKLQDVQNTPATGKTQADVHSRVGYRGRRRYPAGAAPLQTSPATSRRRRPATGPMKSMQARS